MHKPQVYRDVIDRMAAVCLEGQGQIDADRVRRGVWNPNATASEFEDQHRINLLLASLDAKQRDLLAGILTDAFVAGVFETLKALHEHDIQPFSEGYEGAPFNDFIGRLAGDWDWPADT